MENNYLFEFYKERDLGSILSDTFAFLRQNWRDMLAKTWKILLPYLVLVIGFSIFFFMSFGNFIEAVSSENVGAFFTKFFVFILLLLIFSVITELTVLNYIKLYITNEGYVDERELKKRVYKKIFPLIILHILIGIIINIGILFFIIPGIYFSVVLFFAPYIYIFEDKSIGESISASFSLVSGRWWITFGTIIVISLIYGVMGYIFSLPQLIYQLAFPLVKDAQTFNVVDLFKDPVYLLLNVISMLGKFIMSVISLISMALVYFDLYEYKTSSGLINKIDDLGSEA